MHLPSHLLLFHHEPIRLAQAKRLRITPLSHRTIAIQYPGIHLLPVYCASNVAPIAACAETVTIEEKTYVVENIQKGQPVTFHSSILCALSISRNGQ